MIPQAVNGTCLDSTISSVPSLLLTRDSHRKTPDSSTGAKLLLRLGYQSLLLPEMLGFGKILRRRAEKIPRRIRKAKRWPRGTARWESSRIEPAPLL